MFPTENIQNTQILKFSNYKYEPFTCLYNAKKFPLNQTSEKDSKNTAPFSQLYNKDEDENSRKSKQLIEYSPFPSLRLNNGLYNYNGSQPNNQTSNAYKLKIFRRT